MSDMPRQPSATELWLYEAWPIVKIVVDYVPTSEDEADTWVTLEGAKGARRFKWDEIQKCVDVSVGYNDVVRLRRERRDAVKSWCDYERTHAEEVELYRRLKEKYEAASTETESAGDLSFSVRV